LAPSGLRLAYGPAARLCLACASAVCSCPVLTPSARAAAANAGDDVSAWPAANSGWSVALTRAVLPLRWLFQGVALIPIFAPSLLPGLALIYLFGTQGFFKSWLGGGQIYGFEGIVIAQVFYCLPHAMLILVTALATADARLYEAADALGASKLRIFFTVTLPGAKYGVISAALVVFTLVMTDFGVAKVIGGNFNVLATDVYKQVIGQQNFSMGAVVGMVLLAPAALAFVIDRLVQRKQVALLTARAVPLVPRPKNLPVEIWMPIASGKTIDMMARYGLKGMITLNGEKILDDVVRAYHAACEKHGRPKQLGEDMIWGAGVYLADSKEEAMRRLEPAHDERFKWFAPFGFVRYADEQGRTWGSPGAPAKTPTLKDGVSQKAWFCGPPKEVIEGIKSIEAKYPALDSFMIHWAEGLGPKEFKEQLRWFAKDVMPAFKNR